MAAPDVSDARSSGTLRYDPDGAEYCPGAARSLLPALIASLGSSGTQAGIRLSHDPHLARLLSADGRIGSIPAALIGKDSRPVRALLLDKTATTNWALGWHQDRTIVVAERHDVPGFGPWTIKQGLHHVAPPFALLPQMATIRIHLDAVPAGNAPLLIAPGSHRAGMVPVDAIDRVVRDHGVHRCLAAAGDVWAYATPVLHASERAVEPGRRRVLQVDYAAFTLPAPLLWLGIG